MTRLYPKELEKFLNYNRIYIPRILRSEEHLSIHRKYYDLDQEEMFKVIDAYNSQNHDYYTIKSKGRYHVISYPDNHTIYELYKDNKILRGIDIINDEKFYYGYEIIYWFFINKIPLDEKYNRFKSYLTYDSKSCINMNKKYKVVASYDEETCRYYKIRFIAKYNKKGDERYGKRNFKK